MSRSNLADEIQRQITEHGNQIVILVLEGDLTLEARRDAIQYLQEVVNGLNERLDLQPPPQPEASAPQPGESAPQQQAQTMATQVLERAKRSARQQKTTLIESDDSDASDPEALFQPSKSAKSSKPANRPKPSDPAPAGNDRSPSEEVGQPQAPDTVIAPLFRQMIPLADSTPFILISPRKPKTRSRANPDMEIWQAVAHTLEDYLMPNGQMLGYDNASRLVASVQSVFGPVGLESLRAVVRGYRNTTDAEHDVALPDAMQTGRPLEFLARCYQHLLKLEIMDDDLAVRSFAQRVELSKFYRRYQKLCQTITMQQLKDVGYVPLRGHSVATGIHALLVKQQWPHLTEGSEHWKPASRRVHAWKAAGKSYSTIEERFGRVGLAMLTSSWSERMMKDIPDGLLQRVIDETINNFPEVSQFCETLSQWLKELMVSAPDQVQQIRLEVIDPQGRRQGIPALLDMAKPHEDDEMPESPSAHRGSRRRRRQTIEARGDDEENPDHAMELETTEEQEQEVEGAEEESEEEAEGESEGEGSDAGERMETEGGDDRPDQQDDDAMEA